MELNNQVTPLTYRVATEETSDVIFKFADTLTSRAEITDLSAEFSNDVVAVIGAGVAKKLDVELGDRLFFMVQGLTGDIGYAVFFVHGIFASGISEMDKTMGLRSKICRLHPQDCP